MTHLADSLQQYYKISIDWEGNIYCGLTLDWYYSKQTMDISMAGYIKKDLDQVTTPHPQKSIKRTAQSGSKTICGKGEIRERNGWYTVTFSSRNQTPAIKDRKPLISWNICVHEVVS